MKNEIIKKEEKNEIVIDEKLLLNYLDTLGLSTGLTKQETSKFINIAKAFNLNPFKREIYCVAYNTKNGKKLSIIVGFESYIKRAEMTGLLDGWSWKTEGSVKDNTLKAIVTIHRKDWKEPFTHEVYFAEYNQNNSMWSSKPLTMTRKVAIGQAFRLAFSGECGGLPYTEEEAETMRAEEETVSSVVVDSEKIDLNKELGL